MRTGSNQVVWQLKEKEESVTPRIELPPITNIDETWENATRVIVEVARSEIGETEPGRRKIDEQAWLWTDEVEIKVRERKRLYHVFLDDKTDDNWR
ncbi:hypothetical protein Y032_0018g3707 [Ancylostoma ceylanicum]|uniref:Uncharacterized protein n=1 Tax=Ancylostoma ceylanicum TaxID=53326 RepID=A0A016V5W0_9BILA|nr:hypothetical protein Y032_0018g3707 [Ancylostoma ceylanicum]